MTRLGARLVEDIAANGPITVAAFMDRALYDPDDGYYTSAERRSGRAGDFFTSVDVGPLFGRLLANAVATTWAALVDQHPARRESFDLVEAGGGRGQLLADVLDTLRDVHPACYAAVRVTLVERSAVARAAALSRLATHRPCLAGIGPDLPARISGIVFANELLDAFPVHRLVGRHGRIVERWVSVENGRLTGRDGPLSSDALAAFVERTGLTLEEGACADVNLAAEAWLADLASRTHHGYALLVDYGRLPREGTPPRPAASLRAFQGHRLIDEEAEPWLAEPGTRDLTANVGFDVLATAAQTAGWVDLGARRQAQFLLACGLESVLLPASGRAVADVKVRLAAQALVGPGGPGETHVVWLLGRGVDRRLPL